MRERLEYVFAWLLLKFLGSLPRPMARGCGALIAKSLFLMRPPLRRAAEFNLRLAFPELPGPARDAILRRMVRNVGWMAAEFARLPRYTRENIEEAMILDGFENFAAAKRRGKGVLFLTGHMGAWELAGFAHALYNEPIHILVRPIDNRRVDALVTRYRRLSGNRPINKNESARNVLRILRGGGVIGVLADQNAVPAESVFVDFFGIPAATTESRDWRGGRAPPWCRSIVTGTPACGSTACVMIRHSTLLPQTTSRKTSETTRRGSIRRLKITCGDFQINGCGYIGAGRPALHRNPPFTRTSSASTPARRRLIKSLPRRRFRNDGESYGRRFG